MKVLINTPDLAQPGGVSKYFLSLKGRFEEDVDVFTIGKRTQQSQVNWIRLFMDYYHFFKRIHLQKYDIIHLNPSLSIVSAFRDSIFLLLAKTTKSKLIIFWHGWNVTVYDNISNSTFLRFLFKKIFFKADAFIVLANDIEKALLELGYDKPIFKETTVVDENYIATEEVNNKMLLQPEINLLFLCTITREKGVFTAISAFEIVKKHVKNCRLTIAGNGKDLEAVKFYISDNNIEGIHLPGYLAGKEKINAFRNADIYVFPSTHWEGMPISVLEAMAFGLPVVTSNAGGIKDFFENEKMGFIAESLDAETLAGLIIRLINEPTLRQDISNYNQRYALNRFAATRVLARLENIYKNISFTYAYPHETI